MDQDSDDNEYDASEDTIKCNRNKANFNNNNSKEINTKAWNWFTKLENNYYECKKCGGAFKIANNSVTNMKSHLGRKHKMVEFSTSSQINQLNKESKTKPIISKKEKSELDEMALKVIFNDSQGFYIFSKPAMKKFIEFLKPGYKPLSRKTAAYHLKKK